MGTGRLTDPFRFKIGGGTLHRAATSSAGCCFAGFRFGLDLEDAPRKHQ